MLAEAPFDRIEARGFREVRLHLTDAAIAHRFGAVIPERFRTYGNGRGERSRAYTFQVAVTVVDGSAEDHARRASEVAQRGPGTASRSR
jgi:hypothetical protein